MKEFRRREALRHNVGESAVAMRIHRGQYDIKLRVVNAREIYVVGTPVLKFANKRTPQ